MSVELRKPDMGERRQVANLTPLAANKDATSGQRHRWRTRWVLLAAALALVSFAPFLRGSLSAPATSTRLTHTISRGNLIVTVTEEGTLESSSNKEIKCRVKGGSIVLWIIEAGTEVQPGDELVRLDTSLIEENINAKKIIYQNALATHVQSESDVAVAEINIQEYLEGTYRSALKTLQKDAKVAESQLLAARDVLAHSQRLFQKGFINELQLKSDADAVEQKSLELEVFQTDMDVLERYTKPKMLQELQGVLKAKQAKLASDKAALDLEKMRLEREEQQLENCVIRAETSGMVIRPSSAQWKEQPEIEEGALVREDQVLLMIPDLSKMQVKVGVGQGFVDRISSGMSATVKIQDRDLEGEVISDASVTRPAGWWNGNMVKYDTVVAVRSPDGVKPGMSAAVELFLAGYDDVLTIPVAAVVEQEKKFYCWVETTMGPQRRELDLGDSNDQFIVVNGGVKDGDEVVLNPRAYIEEAQIESLRPIDPTSDREPGSGAGDSGSNEKPSNHPKLAGAKFRDGAKLSDEKSAEPKSEGETPSNP